jgi:hypothetical protein
MEGMMKRWETWIGLFTMVCAFGCQADQGDRAKKLHGVAVTQPTGDLVVFLGYDADVKAELQESLQGVEKDKTWYRVHIASTLVPSPAKDKVTWDLAKTTGIEIFYRNAWREMAKPIDRAGHFTLHFTSNTPEVKGTLELASPSAVAAAKGIDNQGNQWGLSYRVFQKGPVTMFGETFEIDLDTAVGGLFVYEQ